MRHKECMYCKNAWEWEDDKMFNFDIPLGIRVWPAVCTECRTILEQKYKSGVLTKSLLTLELTGISGRIALKCAISKSAAMEKIKDFTPKKRGKH